jgi:hypothetical protein
MLWSDEEFVVMQACGCVQVMKQPGSRVGELKRELLLDILNALADSSGGQRQANMAALTQSLAASVFH